MIVEKIEKLKDSFNDKKREIITEYNKNKAYIRETYKEELQADMIQELSKDSQKQLDKAKAEAVLMAKKEIKVEGLEIQNKKDSIARMNEITEKYKTEAAREKAEALKLEKDKLIELKKSNLLATIGIAKDDIGAVLSLVEENREDMQVLEFIEMITKSIDKDKEIRAAIGEIRNLSPDNRLEIAKRSAGTFEMLDNRHNFYDINDYMLLDKAGESNPYFE